MNDKEDDPLENGTHSSAERTGKGSQQKNTLSLVRRTNGIVLVEGE